MIGLLNWLWTAFLKVFGLARTNTMIDLEGDGSVSDPALVNPVDQSEEGSNWRGAPGEYPLLAIFTISLLPEVPD